MIQKQDLTKITDYLYEIPANFRKDMKVPARIYSDEKLLEAILQDESLVQTVNVATLPGIVKYSLAMPDIHQGYGFPIGGVAATRVEDGVISPGGIGYDINCGLRVLSTSLTFQEIQPYLEKLADNLFHKIPAGVGRGGKIISRGRELEKLLTEGAAYVVKMGHGIEEDLEHTEERGRFQAANPDKVSARAKKRGEDQSGTLGSGNHFLEIQRVDQIFDEAIASQLGVFKDGITIMIHSGSRGLGYQVCADYLRLFRSQLSKYGYRLPDPELIYVPFQSESGQDYFQAMAAAANYAWANRQNLMYLVREVVRETLSKNMELPLIYDVAHNIAKIEEHTINNKIVKLVVHRKGATRAFPANHPDIPGDYKTIGQPVLIPGDMGTASYLLVGTEKAMADTFGSVCHGAGRLMSRKRAKATFRGNELVDKLKKQGVIIRSDSMPSLAEEAPGAYKNIDRVVNVVVKAGLSKKVARLTPLVVVKGS